VDDPEITEFLERAIQPGGVFENGKHLNWAMEEYGRKAGKKAIPLLLRILKEGTLANWKTRQKDDPFPEELVEGTAEGAATALAAVAGPDQIPELNKILLANDRARQELALGVISAISDESAKQALLNAYRAIQDERFRSRILGAFEWHGSRDLTPFIIEAFGGVPGKRLLEILSAIWGSIPPDYPVTMQRRFPETLNMQEEEALRRKVEEIILEGILSNETEIAEAALDAARKLEMTTAIPYVERRLTGPSSEDLFWPAVRLLASLRSEDSFRAMVKLTWKADAADARRWITRLMAEWGGPLCVSRLKGLLDDQEKVNVDGWRLCDCAANCLSGFYPAGPRSITSADTIEQRDKIIGEWKGFSPTDAIRQSTTPPEESLSTPWIGIGLGAAFVAAVCVVVLLRRRAVSGK
ncbi:MAG: hypothetical protein RDV41_14545, partial [Planctomycetota bacterium]|nr:hypothetical protein [Planctomycetota bacterium]